jgi:hypothetical protein
MLVPMPIAVPPHEPANHSVTAPAPTVPPDTVNVVLAPLQMVVLPVIPVGATDVVNGLTVTVTDAQLVVLQAPEYLT